jgi:Na+-transporting methylmalonyl-CoA/oxaloacetate decarboxylase gamma subunit
MARSRRVKYRKLLKTARLGVGFVVLTSLIGTSFGIGVVLGIDAVHDLGGDSAYIGGMFGAWVGAVISSGMLAVGSFARTVRRKLIMASERASSLLTWIGTGGIVLIVAFVIVAFVPLGLSGFPDWLNEHGVGGKLVLVVAAGVFYGAVLGVGVGLLALTFLVIATLGRIIARLCQPAVAHRRPEPAQQHHSVVTPGGWPIQAAAALMPATARHRWLEDVAEALHDHPAEQHSMLLRNFLLHAPAVIAWTWPDDLRRRALRVDKLPGHGDDT